MDAKVQLAAYAETEKGMSDQDKSQPSGQSEPNQGERPQGEREHTGGSGSGASSTGGGAAGAGSSGGGRPRHGRNRRRSSTPQQQQSGQARDAEPSFNLGELRELVELFTSNGLSEFEFENEDIRVRLSRNPVASAQAFAPAPTHAPALTSQAASGTSAAGAPSTGGGASSHAPSAQAAAEGDADAGDGLQVVTAPIVGTFYRSPSPEADPFVRPGSHVEADTTVCIIEAMKLMNEIPAELAGTVEKIYVENGQPVEYGQPLFGIRK